MFEEIKLPSIWADWRQMQQRRESTDYRMRLVK